MQIQHSNKIAFVISMLFNVYWLLSVLVQEKAWFLLLALLFFAFLFDRASAVAAPLIALIGISVDVLLTALGIFVFDTHSNILSNKPFINTIASFPLWLVFLWLGFGTYAWLLRHILLKNMGVMLVILCAVSGSSSYYAGMKLGAVTFSESLTTTLMLLFVLWAFYAWLFSRLIAFLSTRVFKEVNLANENQHKPFLSTDIKYW